MANACLYYRDGLCFSPRLDTPTDSVTLAKRCLTEQHKTCSFYIEKEEQQEKKGVEKYTPEKQEILIYAPVNVIERPELSECDYFVMMETDKGTVAKCKIMGRILTKSQAKNCVAYWNTCPIRKSV